MSIWANRERVKMAQGRECRERRSLSAGGLGVSPSFPLGGGGAASRERRVANVASRHDTAMIRGTKEALESLH